MRIHRVNGKSLREALERARALHGDQALVLSHETTAVGVTVAVTAPARKLNVHELVPAEASAEKGRLDVERRLVRNGASSAFIRSVLADVEHSGARGIAAIDAAAAAIERRFSIADSPKAGEAPAVIAFVGPTGVGKTTTLAKLAAKLVRSRRRVALVAADTQRAGGVEHLSAHARFLQSPLFVARDPRELSDAIERTRSADAVLIDTAGHSPSDAELVHKLTELLADRAHARYLALAATASRGALELAIEAFQGLAPSALVLTKLDETREPAGALELAASCSLPVAFLCDGQEIARHLHRASSKHFASLFLRGRIE